MGRQRRKFFEEIDMVDSLMDNFFMPKMRIPFCPEMICQTSNERSLRLPMDIPRENIKTTINKKTGVLTVEASNENEKDVSRYGWTGTQNSFSSFKKSIKLPEYVLTDDDLLAKISADFGKNNILKITLPEKVEKTEQMMTSENKSEGVKKSEESDLVQIETVNE